MTNNLHRKSVNSINVRRWKKNLTLGLLITFCHIVIVSPSMVFAQPENAKPTSYKDLMIGASGLVLQPLYLAIKLATGITGTLISGGTLLVTGGNEDAAKEVFDRSWAGPWGIPELFKDMEGEPRNPN